MKATSSFSLTDPKTKRKIHVNKGESYYMTESRTMVMGCHETMDPPKNIRGESILKPISTRRKSGRKKKSGKKKTKKKSGNKRTKKKSGKKKTKKKSGNKRTKKKSKKSGRRRGTSSSNDSSRSKSPKRRRVTVRGLRSAVDNKMLLNNPQLRIIAVSPGWTF